MLSNLWKQVKQLGEETKSPLQVKWPSSKVKFMDEIKRLKDIKEGKILYSGFYDIFFDNSKKTNNNVNFSVIHKKNATNKEIEEKFMEEKGDQYDGFEITNFRVLDKMKIQNVDKVKIPLKKGSSGNRLIYPHMGTLKTKEENDECVYNCFREKYGVEKNIIIDIIKKDITKGLTLEDIKLISEHLDISIYIIDQSGRDLYIRRCAQKKNSRDRKPQVFLMANEHLYNLDDENRKKYLNMYKFKKDKVSKTYYDTAKESKKKETKKKKIRKEDINEIITMKNIPSIQDIKENQYIYIAKDNLYDDYVYLLKKGICYASDLDNNSQINTIYLKEKNTILYANGGYKQIIKYRQKFEDEKEEVKYCNNPSIPVLSRMVFDKLKKGKKWDLSYFNQELEKLLYETHYGGKNFTYGFNSDEHKSHSIQEIDFYRCYTSIALQGGFYYVNINDDLQEFTGISDNKIYYVETNDKELFYLNGLYDYKVVKAGIKYGIITKDNIKYEIRIQHSGENDKIIKEFIETVYNRKSSLNKRDEDKLNKQMCNFLFGSFGKKYKTKYINRYLTNSPVDAFAHYTDLSKGEDIETRIKTIIDNEQKDKFYFVSAINKQTLFGNNLLLRNCIVQRATLKLYELKREIEKIPSSFILKVKTDAITYAVNLRVDNPYPVSKKPTFNDLRKQKPKKEFYSYINKLDNAEPYKLKIMNKEWIDHSNKENINTQDYFDYRKILKYDRLFVRGFAGSGKSYIIKQLYNHLIKDNKRAVKLSFTNIAALNIQGQTIHKFFGIGGEYDAFDSAIKKVDYIILDEISMIPRDLWNRISKIPKHIKIYSFGDFRQLPPVEKCDLNYEHCSFIKQIFNNNLIVLKKQCRADAEFANNCVKYHDKDIKFSTLGIDTINEQPTKDNLPDYNLCRTNNTRKKINNILQEKYGDDKNKIKEIIKKVYRNEDINKSTIKYTEFTNLYKDMPVIFIKPRVDKNKEKKKKLKKKKKYDGLNEDDKIIALLMDKSNTKDGLNTDEYKIVADLVNNEKCKIEKVENSFITISKIINENVKSNDENTYNNIKIPTYLFITLFKPSYATTIHKSQGETINKTYAIHEFFLKYGKYMKSRYTGLTRATNKKFIKIFK